MHSLWQSMQSLWQSMHSLWQRMHSLWQSMHCTRLPHKMVDSLFGRNLQIVNLIGKPRVMGLSARGASQNNERGHCGCGLGLPTLLREELRCGICRCPFQTRKSQLQQGMCSSALECSLFSYSLLYRTTVMGALPRTLANLTALQRLYVQPPRLDHIPFCRRRVRHTLLLELSGLC